MNAFYSYYAIAKQQYPEVELPWCVIKVTLSYYVAQQWKTKVEHKIVSSGHATAADADAVRKQFEEQNK